MLHRQRSEYQQTVHHPWPSAPLFWHRWLTIMAAHLAEGLLLMLPLFYYQFPPLHLIILFLKWSQLIHLQNWPTDYSERLALGLIKIPTLFKYSTKISKVHYITIGWQSNQYIYHLLTLYISVRVTLHT